MSFQSNLFKDENGKMYFFRRNEGAELVVGTLLLSSRRTPLHANYDRQYKPFLGGDVLVVQSGEIVALIPDFDPNFVVQESELNAVSVVDAEGDVEAVYIAAGEGLLNVGTLVYDDPAGEVAYEGVIIMGNWEITIVAGAVASVAELEVEAPELETIKTEIFNNEGESRVIYMEGSPKFLTKVGTEVFADSELEVAFAGDGVYTHPRLSIYSFTIEGGKVVDVAKVGGEDRKK